MLQHGLLMMAAPPLLLLGAPLAPVLRGLPHGVRTEIAGPLLGSKGLRRAARALVHPVSGWLALAVATWAWHLPAAYELALRSPAWHAFEHACFFGSALLFWWPVVLPFPSRAVWPRAAMIPYLVLADLQNTAFSALFAFSDRALYPGYAAAAGLFGRSPLSDQADAGALMWILGSAAFLAPIGFVVREVLAPAVRPRGAGAAAPRRAVRGHETRRIRLASRARAALRSLALRRGVQAAALALAAAAVADGLIGPRMSAMNLAGALPWVWWRGLVVLGALGAGSLFCFACPFMLVRDAARRWLPARRRWPRRLRSKWLAAALLGGLLAASEAFSLWDDPRATAILVAGYFAAAVAVDGAFRGASFCKYVCPIGQFQFLAATLSPRTVKVRTPATCRTCATRDCIRGGPSGRGCETGLFAPAKVGNLDCTFCLDCVRACPHDNVALARTAPARELTDDAPRSSLGRLSRRPDVAALALVFVAGAFTTAAAMIAPVGAAIGRVAVATGSRPLAEALFFGAGLAAAPAFAIAACAHASARLSGAASREAALRARLCLALVPLGLGMWAAHFVFHFATAASSLVPVAQRIAQDLGLRLFGAPDWRMAQPGAPADLLLGLEILLLDLGLLLTLAAGWRIAERAAATPRRALAAFAAPGLLGFALWVLGLWILSEPMQMRGAMAHG